MSPASEAPAQESKASSSLSNVLRSFRLNRSGILAQSSSSPATPSSHTENRSSTHLEYFGEDPKQNGQDLVERIMKGKPMGDRVAAAHDLCEVIEDFPPVVITGIWSHAHDLVERGTPREAKRAGFRLLAACINSQTEISALDRLRYYRAIERYVRVDDFQEPYEALKALTNGGKNLESFERHIVGLLTNWLRLWFDEARKTRKQRKKEPYAWDELASVSSTGAPENYLKDIFKFTTDIIKFNFHSFQEDEIKRLLAAMISICKETVNKRDVVRSLEFVSTVVTFGYVPQDIVPRVINLMCEAYATSIQSLVESSMAAFENLCKSHMGHRCIVILIDMCQKPARDPKNAPTPNSIRGAAWYLEMLLRPKEGSNLPVIPFSIAMMAIDDSLASENLRLASDMCKLITKLLHSPDCLELIGFDWHLPLKILMRCSRKTPERADGVSLLRYGMKKVPDVPSIDNDKKVTETISQYMFEAITALEELCRKPEFDHAEEVCKFFVEVFGHTADSTAEWVISYYDSEHLCYPSCAEWLDNARLLMDIIFRTTMRPSDMRVSVLELLKNVYETIRTVCDEEILKELVEIMLGDLQAEEDPKVLEALVKIVVDVAGDSDMEVFNKHVDSLRTKLNLDPRAPAPVDGDNEPVNDSPTPLSRPSHAFSYYGSLRCIVTKGLVRIFMKNMHTDVPKAVRAYEELVKIAGSENCEADARLAAFRLLFRIRADSEHHVFLTDNMEADYLAGVLYRTRDTPDMNGGSSATTSSAIEDAPSRSNRSNSVTQANFITPRSLGSGPGGRIVLEKAKKSVLWQYPELRPLPERQSQEASPVLTTFYDPPPPPSTPGTPDSDIPADPSPPAPSPRLALRMSHWMEKVIPIIQQGSDWELYSYVLVHLPSQLANKTAFRNCKASISIIRNYVCNQLHTKRFPEVELPAPVAKADVPVGLVHLLTVLISYREHFSRNEMEGIVKAFMLGLGSWTRTKKPCIHALTLCCYELPNATGRVLHTILETLSKLISTSSISVHILELLFALAKLPRLYSNFTEQEYKFVFGIAFGYIQHARENSARIDNQNRASFHSAAERRPGAVSIPAEQPDLPQYVLTLAYNVLTTWFLCLKVPDRQKYGSLIIRGLVVRDNREQALSQVDEQSEATIDILQRFTFSSYDLPPPAKLELSDKVVTKTWVNGNAVLSIQMRTDTGISRVTVRRPAGNSYYSMKPESLDAQRVLMEKYVGVEDNIEGDDQDDFAMAQILPSHLLLQFLGGAGYLEETRPILLPDDDAARRSIEAIDRIPVVNFHKVGVVYVGAGQTKESEILANEMGSPEYTDFVDGLGSLIKLKGSERNTGGLDRSEHSIDGEFAYLWHDRTTEIMWHVTTMMPNHAHDPQFTQKKQHIGNDYVNIVFNNSGLPWRFGTIPSQFNYVSIIISPEARSSFVSSRLATRAPEDKDKTFYRVQVCCRDGFSDISPAQEPKMVSASSLPAFIRNLALNANVYANVFSDVEHGTETVSNPRHRLRQIKTMRERYGPKPDGPQTNGVSPGGGDPTSSIALVRTSIGVGAGPASRRTSAMSAQSDLSVRSSLMGGSSSATLVSGGEGDREAAQDALVARYDFNRYT